MGRMQRIDVLPDLKRERKAAGGLNFCGQKFENFNLYTRVILPYAKVIYYLSHNPPCPPKPPSLLRPSNRLLYPVDPVEPVEPVEPVKPRQAPSNPSLFPMTKR